MEVFGLRKTFCFNYTRFSPNEHYLFMFEDSHNLDLEKVFYSDLLEACDSMFLLTVANTSDWNNVVATNNLFIPKYSTTEISAQTGNTQNSGGSTIASSIRQHLMYAPSNTIMTTDESSMRWYEYSSRKTASEYSSWVLSTVITTNSPIEYAFDRPIDTNCFVIQQSTPTRRAFNLEAFIDDQWVTILNSFTPNNANAAVVFDSVTSDKFRLTFNISHTITMTAAYFGKFDYTEQDIYYHDYNFTQAILCPSSKLSSSLQVALTSSINMTDGFDIPSLPCMTMDVSTSNPTADVLLAVQDNQEARMGMFIMGGYLV